MGKQIIRFNKGIQFPAKLGALVLKMTGEGLASSAQNVDTQNDEYGNEVSVPGPGLTTIGSNSELTGVPFAKLFFGSSLLNKGYLYFLQGVLGTATIIRRVKDILSGSTPVVDTTGSMTADHGPSHANQKLIDILFRADGSGNNYAYVAGKDDTDTWVMKFDPSQANPSLSDVAANVNFTGGYSDQFLVLGDDKNIYWIGKNRVSSIDTADAYTVSKLANGLPPDLYASCGANWNKQLLVGCSTDAFGDFARRLSAGSSAIIVWDYVSPSFSNRIPAPCRYISAIIPAPDGTCLVFGGIDEGKSSIYEFTGYGFRLLTSYIGDMPRSRHNVDFDSQGRILFNTVDGQICRYDKTSGRFEHLGTISTGSSAGGILAKLIGSPVGNEFIVASGSGATYLMKRVNFGSYIGDGDALDGINTPKRTSGTEILSPKSTISAISIFLGKSLAFGEKIEVRLYKNGDTNYTVYMTLSYTDDGAIAMKRTAKVVSEVNTYNIEVAWKMADGATTAPPVNYALVETNEKI